MEKNSFLIILASATIIFIVIGFFFFREDESSDGYLNKFTGPISFDIKESVVVGDGVSPSKVIEMAMSERGITADLHDVTGGTREGSAYLLRNGSLYHYVVANLPLLAPGKNVYEGWLVKETPTLQFVSTGVMGLNPDGMYMLSFMADDEYSGYDQVVITEETSVDGTPETHILEGDLQ